MSYILYYELDKECFRFEKSNINAMINGYYKENDHFYQFIYAITEKKYEYFINKARRLIVPATTDKFKPKKEILERNPFLNNEINGTYIAVCERVYDIRSVKNKMSLWNELCEKSDYFSIWDKEEPYKIYPVAIGLLRVYKCYDTYLHVLKNDSDHKYPYIKDGSPRSVIIERPIIISNVKFDQYRVAFEKTIEKYLPDNCKVDILFGKHDDRIKDDEIEQIQILAKKIIDQEPNDKETKRILTELSLLKRDKKAVSEIKSLYNYTCQICENKLPISNVDNYCEVHHIQPVGMLHNGPDLKSNMICVCPNHHVQLDYGFLDLDLDNLKLNKHQISTEFIDYYNKNIKKNKKP